MKQQATSSGGILIQAATRVLLTYLTLLFSNGIILQASGLTIRSTKSIKMSTSMSTTSPAASNQVSKDNKLFKIRTITAFVTLNESDFSSNKNNSNDDVATSSSSSMLEYKIKETTHALQTIRKQLEDKNNFEVQTLRVATNPFPEYLLPSSSTGTDITDADAEAIIVEKRLKLLDDCLEKHGITFFSLGSASTKEHLKTCTQIVQYSTKFSCSVQLQANDIELAKASAETVLRNSKLIVKGSDADAQPDGLANFRFCVANVKPYIPFFPAAKSGSSKDDEDVGGAFQIKFAIGLENGELLKYVLMNDANQSIANILPPPPSSIPTTNTGDNANNKNKRSNFATGFSMAVRPIQITCEKVVSDWNTNDNSEITYLKYIGLDASFNPSLDSDGSVASAIESLNEVKEFGGPGTIAVVAAMTTAIQTKLSCDDATSPIKLTGYNGLMLPLCEDIRLAQLAVENKLTISQLLNVSSVCGVGIDTVPIAGNTCPKELSSLLLDVVGLAQRWNKPLSCRVFPVPNKVIGDMTTFNSPYLVNSKILPLS
jgi:uncharacterized protein (UPF0210 family)